MTVVQSLGTLTDLQPNWMPSSGAFGAGGGMSLYDGLVYDYAAIYRTQPNVRICVDFIARNIAQLGLHAYRRVSDTDRVRLTGHSLNRFIKRPNPYTTRYRLINSLFHDLGIYDNAFWLKIRPSSGGDLAALRIPPVYMKVKGGLVPTAYQIWLGGKVLEVPPSEIVHFHGYNPDNPIVGLSPMETLRRILAEEAAAGDWRESYWKRAARVSGVVERPTDAPEWSDDAQERWRADFEAIYSGAAGAGKTMVLEEGMTFRPTSYSAVESQYLEARKLAREECAASYFIPPPLVGILDHATFSNITEQHKNLYQDCLGPSTVMAQEEMELQLVPDFEDVEDVYLEFNITEKLKGSFEEQATSMSALVGRPVMTANEGRARLNLPSKGGDADELVTPLNVLVGGQASPRDSAPPKTPPKALPAAKAVEAPPQIVEVDPTNFELRKRHMEKWAQVVGRFFGRQRSVVEGKAGQKGAKAMMLSDLWDDDRWNKELAADIYALNIATATVWGKEVAKAFGLDWDPDYMLSWLSENARIGAEEINATTKSRLIDALRSDTPLDGIKQAFSEAADVRAPEIAKSKVTTSANFGANDAAEEAARTSKVMKTWKVNSSNPRTAHRALSGVSVPLGERFSNGMKWPGDPAGGADQVAGCMCSITFRREIVSEAQSVSL